MAISLADVLRRFAPAYCQRYPNALLPSHDRAIRDILACHTPAMGGHLWYCPQCDKDVYAYHGCRNRSCLAGSHNQRQEWLAQGCPGQAAHDPDQDFRCHDSNRDDVSQDRRNPDSGRDDVSQDRRNPD